MSTLETPVAEPVVTLVPEESLDPIMEAAKLIRIDPITDQQPEVALAALDKAGAGTTGLAESVAEKLPGTPAESVVEAAAPAEPAPLSAAHRARALAALTRKERLLKAERGRLNSQREEADRYKTELEAMKADPIAYLEKQNPDFYSEYTQRKLNDGQPSPAEDIRQIRDQLAALKEENTKLQEQTTRSSQDQVIQQARKDIGTLFQDDEFELSRAYGAEDEVLNLIAMQYQQTGQDLTIKEAAGMIESELESRVERLRTTKKFQSGQAGIAAATETAPTPTQTTSTGPRTLTNEMTGSAQAIDVSEMDTYNAIRHLADQIKAGAA